DGFDPLYDYPEPPIPPGGNYVQVYFNHPDWLPVLGYKFNRDIREPLEPLESIYWEFEVASTPNVEVTLSWPDINDEVPEDYRDFQLIEDEVVVIGDMRETTEYSFVSEGLRHFSIGATLGISDRIMEIPKVYTLSQNYPNPFNPITTFKYGLPKRSGVSLKIYNILGREVTTLIDRNQEAGYHQFQWDARNLSSGIYFYRIQAYDVSGSSVFSQTRKLVLLK
ncbi:T9SS type A sorting domain-containing protein, partial [candidate division KSB1 bacterium]|nr:T9SS type A sorting domain-containing protein [candidate division KSB1 bacterium]